MAKLFERGHGFHDEKGDCVFEDSLGGAASQFQNRVLFRTACKQRPELPDAESVDNKNLPGLRFFDGFVDAGCDKETIQIRAAKSAGRGFQAGKVDPLEKFSGDWVETCYATAVAKGDPEFIFRIDGHAVWRAVETERFCVDGDPGIGDFTGRDIVVVGTDLSGRGVNVVDCLCVSRPADAV